MKNKKIILTCLGIIILILLIDFALVLIFKTTPLFALRSSVTKDSGSREYYAVGYKVLKCNRANGNKTIKIGFYNMKDSCDNEKVEDSVYQLNDDTKIVYRKKTSDELRLAVIIPIYEDNEYRYLLNDAHAYVEYKGNQLSYKEALNQGVVTIHDLLTSKAFIVKEVKKVEHTGNDETCTFIRTFRIVDKLNFQSTDNITKFLILDQFQMHDPFILGTKLDVSKLEPNKFYEFTFTGLKKYSGESDLLKHYNIDSIKSTDKEGLAQIQEPCR